MSDFTLQHIRMFPEDQDMPAEEMTKEYLGGKGYGLFKMCQMWLPVPPGVVIPTSACLRYRRADPKDRDKLLNDLVGHFIQVYLPIIRLHVGHEPLLSVRSGAAISMPGMMDTILNVGLTTHNFAEWKHRIGLLPTMDCRRRLIQMLGSTAYGVPAEAFDFQLRRIKKEHNAKLDSDMSEAALHDLLQAYQKVFKDNQKFDFPSDSATLQLKAAIAAVFNSWDNERAAAYRSMNGIPHDIGTACVIQAMVFGNAGETSGSGVGFTRNPSTGEKVFFGEYLPNAQGEDVVAGIRTPLPMTEKDGMILVAEDLAMSVNKEWIGDLEKVCEKLEEEFRDMVDLEFTVQEDKFWMLQCRVGKRSAAAAFKIAHDLVKEEVIDVKEAFSRLSRTQLRLLRRPSIDPSFTAPHVHQGIPACPGVATGRPVFTAGEAVAAKDPVILVRHETDPDDIEGMAKAAGILTKTGGSTSHAAVVARSMDKPCVVGTTSLSVGAMEADAKNGEAPKVISICGSTGRVWFEAVPLAPGADTPEVAWLAEEALLASGRHLPGMMPDDSATQQAIVAYEWMDDPYVMEVVLSQMAGDAARFILDLRPETAHWTMPEDRAILDLFNEGKYPGEVDLGAVLGEIAKSKQDLNGLTLMLPIGYTVFPATAELLGGNGIKILQEAGTFAELMQEGSVLPGSLKEMCDITGFTDHSSAYMLTLMEKAGHVRAPRAESAVTALFEALN